MPPELRVLFGKEWRQLVRSRTAMITALALPFLLMVVMPLIQVLAVTKSGGARGPQPTEGLPPAFAEAMKDPKAMARMIFPLFVAISGLIVPSVTATYTVIAERESRTLELLIALPVRVGQVIAAKLLSLVVLATSVTFLLLAIDAAVLVVLGIAGPAYIAILALLLFSAIAASTAAALWVSVLARDFRSANNINGIIFGPLVIVSLAATFLSPSPIVGCAILSAIFLVGGAAAAWAATRSATFEKLLR